MVSRLLGTEGLKRKTQRLPSRNAGPAGETQSWAGCCNPLLCAGTAEIIGTMGSLRKRATPLSPLVGSPSRQSFVCVS